MNDTENNQQVKHLNPNYIYFSLKRTMSSEVRIPLRNRIQALPQMPNLQWHKVQGTALLHLNHRTPTNVNGHWERE